jgi:hypothetical protein
MEERIFYFEHYLQHRRSDELKRIATVFGGGSLTRKDQYLKFIFERLRQPKALQQVVENLAPLEHNALAVLNANGYLTESNALAIALRVAAVDLPNTKARDLHQSDINILVLPLISSGLLFPVNIDSMYYDSFGGAGYGRMQVSADPRILQYAPAFPTCEPFELPAASPPATTLVRRPQAVLLDILGLLQAIESLGKLELTKNGNFRVNTLRKLGRALGWNEKSIDFGGLPFPAPIRGFAEALATSGFMVDQDDAMVLIESVAEFSQRSLFSQIRSFVRGFVHSQDWYEYAAPAGLQNNWYANRYIAGRMALLLALAALPTDHDGFFALADLDAALYERIGEHFAIGFAPNRPYTFGVRNAEQKEQTERNWHEQRRKFWRDETWPWFCSALKTWVYAMGLVELGFEGDQVVSLRLSDLGRLLLHPQREPPPALDIAANQEEQPAWLVQPTFDVLVYLDRVSPAQLAALELYGERSQVQQHTAQYRLSREALYHALEQGATLEGVLEWLRAGAMAELPQNVVAELESWAALRERMTLHRSARLVEFSSRSARDNALKRSLPGRAVGEHFVLLTSTDPDPTHIQPRINYTEPLPRCLKISEDGLIEFQDSNEISDLLIADQIDRWAEREGEGRWRLTQASVTAALKAKRSSSDLFGFFLNRSLRPLPPLLHEVLKHWMQQPAHVGLATVTVLKCSRPALIKALEKSKRFRGMIRGRLAPDLLLVDSAAIETLRDHLHWAGIEIGDEVLGSTE